MEVLGIPVGILHEAVQIPDVASFLSDLETEKQFNQFIGSYVRSKCYWAPRYHEILMFVCLQQCFDSTMLNPTQSSVHR